RRLRDGGSICLLTTGLSDFLAVGSPLVATATTAPSAAAATTRFELGPGRSCCRTGFFIAQNLVGFVTACALGLVDALAALRAFGPLRLLDSRRSFVCLAGRAAALASPVALLVARATAAFAFGTSSRFWLGSRRS